jgi:hypothetical protein
MVNSLFPLIIERWLSLVLSLSKQGRCFPARIETKRYGSRYTGKSPITRPSTVWVFVRIAAQQGIEIFHTAEIRADGDVFNGAMVKGRRFRGIPRAFILFPGNLRLRSCQVDIHVGAAEFLDDCIHTFLRTCDLFVINFIHSMAIPFLWQAIRTAKREGVLKDILAKLCGKDNPGEIADWAKNEAEELSLLMGLERTRMPHHNLHSSRFLYFFMHHAQSYSRFPSISSINFLARSRSQGVGSFSARSRSRDKVSGWSCQYLAIASIAASRG